MPFTIFDQMKEDWSRTVSRSGTRACYRRWRAEIPELRHVLNLGRLVNEIRQANRCQADRLLGSLLRLDDATGLANRVVLEAVTPGLLLTCRRLRGPRWTDDDLASAVIAAAWEVIAHYPIDRRPSRIPANILMDTRKRALCQLGQMAGRSSDVSFEEYLVRDVERDFVDQLVVVDLFERAVADRQCGRLRTAHRAGHIARRRHPGHRRSVLRGRRRFLMSMS